MRVSFAPIKDCLNCTYYRPNPNYYGFCNKLNENLVSNQAPLCSFYMPFGQVTAQIDASMVISGLLDLDRIPRLTMPKLPVGSDGYFLKGQGASDSVYALLALADIPNLDWAHISALFPRTSVDLLNDVSSIVMKGLFANRPTAGLSGRLYWATDTDEVYRDTGAAWEQVMQSVNLKTGDFASSLVGISGTATGRAALLDKLDALISSRLAAASYVTERGTDNAALASVCTETRLSKLDAAVSSRSTLTQANILSDATPFAGANVGLLSSVVRLWDYVVSDNLKKSDDSEASTSSTTMSKLKSITFNPSPPAEVCLTTLRIKFDLKTTTVGYAAYGQIYKNSVAVGTLQSTTSTSYVTFTQDIGGWNVNDTIELWAKIANAAATASVQNFRIYADVSQHTVAAPTW